MSRSVSYALFGALLCTITPIPGMTHVAQREPRKVFHNHAIELLQPIYGNALSKLPA